MVKKNNLKSIRNMLKVRQYELTQKTGIPQSRISLAENGWIELEQDEKTKLAEALNVRIDVLFEN